MLMMKLGVSLIYTSNILTKILIVPNTQLVTINVTSKMNGKTNKDNINVMTTVIVMVPENVTEKDTVKVMPDQTTTTVQVLKKVMMLFMTTLMINHVT